MKFAVRLFVSLAMVALLLSIMSCGTGRQLHWQGAEQLGVYSFAAAILFAAIAAIVFAVDWVRQNVRLQ